MNKRIIAPTSHLKCLGKIDWGKVSKLFCLLWIVIQIVLIIIFWNVEQRSDQGVYIKMALEYYERGGWYPDTSEIISSFIWAPGLINFFILQLKIFGTLKVNYFINMLMNIGILWNIWYISNRFFSRRTAQISSIMFCIMYSNIMVVLPAGTEIPFTFLAVSAFSLSLSNSSYWKLVLSGVLLALANWIRPLSIVFVTVILLYMYKKKSKAGHYIAMLLPILLLTISFGCMAKKQMGYFTFQSTTSGVNLIMTANDKAYGGVATSLFGDSTTTCYIKNSKQYTFVEKDSIWKARSIEWIKEHPAKFIGLYVAKLVGMYVEDSWAERPIIGGDGFVDKAAHGKADKMAIIKRIINMISKSIVYYFVMFIFIVSIIKNRNDLVSDKGYVVLILLLGTMITCVLSVTPRYHYPFMFAIVIWAAYALDDCLMEKNDR